MSNELFFDINEEQQEAVAGGKSIYDYLSTYLNEDESFKLLKVGIASTRQGSVIDQEFAENDYKFNTNAYKNFNYNDYPNYYY